MRSDKRGQGFNQLTIVLFEYLDREVLTFEELANAGTQNREAFKV